MINRRHFLLAGVVATWPPATPSAERPGLISQDILLPSADPERALPVRVLAPPTGQRLPIVVFSHGAYSSGTLYDAILRNWAGAGCTVLAPTHRDSVSLGVARGANDPRYFRWRLDDMDLLLGSLAEIQRQVPGLEGRLDSRRVAATGHSFGGLVAQTVSGATYYDSALSSAQSRRLPNIRATVIVSGAGRIPPLLRSEDFAALHTPLLVSVGTEDLQQAPGLTGYQWRREPYDLAASRQRYLLTLEGCDHYLGASIGRDDLPRHARATEWLTAFNTVSLWFLARYLLGERRAAPAVPPHRIDAPRS